MPQHLTFSRLVQNDKDFVGMVAYTVYKNEKLNWIKEFKSKPQNHNTEPTQAQLDNGFNLDSDSPLKIARYRAIAETMLNDFMDETITEELEIAKNNLRQDTLVKEVKSLQNYGLKDAWFNVWTGWVGSGLIALGFLLYGLSKVVNNPIAMDAIIKKAGQ